jgi:hypothetical protein
LIRDYDLSIHYNPSRVNVVADAMSRKFVSITSDWPVADFERMGISYCFVGVAIVETKFVLETALRSATW